MTILLVTSLVMLFAAADAIGKSHRPAQRPTAPIPMLKPDQAATWNALAADAARLARHLRKDVGR